MTYCPARLWGASTGLCCTRVDAHLTGHIYQSAWAPDVHTEEVRDD